MVAESTKLVRLSEVIEVPSGPSEGDEVNGKEIVDIDIVITGVTLQNGRGDAKGSIVGGKFSLLLPTSGSTDILEDGRPVFLISRNEVMVKQAQALAKAAQFPLLARLTKRGRSYFWS